MAKTTSPKLKLARRMRSRLEIERHTAPFQSKNWMKRSRDIARKEAKKRI